MAKGRCKIIDNEMPNGLPLENPATPPRSRGQWSGWAANRSGEGGGALLNPPHGFPIEDALTTIGAFMKCQAGDRV